MVALSIYIPTWNRQHLLNRLLESIEPQLTPEVDVFVSVNRGPTKIILPNWVNNRFTKVNIGGDANIISGPTLVNGKYIWVIGDDEQLLPGAIATTLDALKKSPGLILHPDGIHDFGFNLGSTFSNYANFCEAAIAAGTGYLLTAHTLISSNTFIRSQFDLSLAFSKLDTKYGFHYGMMGNILQLPVKIADQPTIQYGNEASIFAHSQDEIRAHMDLYPTVMYEIFDWISACTGYPIPRDCWKPGFDR